MQIIQPIIQFLGLKAPNELILPITVLFITAVLVTGIVRLILLYSSIKYANSFIGGATQGD